MVTSFCLLFLGVLAAFAIARFNKSATLYVVLLALLFLGFVVGTGVKRVVANAQNTPAKSFEFTASIPTTQCSFSAFVQTVNDEDIVLSQEKTIEVGTVKTNDTWSYNVLRNVAIENDS